MIKEENKIIYLIWDNNHRLHNEAVFYTYNFSEP